MFPPIARLLVDSSLTSSNQTPPLNDEPHQLIRVFLQEFPNTRFVNKCSSNTSNTMKSIVISASFPTERRQNQALTVQTSNWPKGDIR
jgi:hypothetical protein